MIERQKKIENSVKYSIVLLKEINRIIFASEKIEFEFYDHSLVQWLNPMGIIEIILIEEVEIKIQNEFKISIVDKIIGILQNLENGMAKLPPATQSIYLPDILKIKEELHNSKTYKSLALSK